MIKHIFNTVSLSAFIFIATCASTVSAVVPIPTLDDNGNASFVRQIVPKLLGRKPKGSLEIKLLKDIADLQGRESLVRLLMEQDEFIAHWRAILIDHLKVQRAVILQKNRQQTAECFEKNATAIEGLSIYTDDPQQANSLAEFVRDLNSTAPYSMQFNMHDLITSSLHLDNLFPAYRGYLYVLASHPNGTGMRTIEQARAEVGAAFDDIFLNRNMQCLSCHRGTYSKTVIGERTHPLYANLDNAVFNHSNQSELGDIEEEEYVDHCANCHGSNGEGESGPPIQGISKAKFNTAVEVMGSTMSTIPIPGDDVLNSIIAALQVKSVFDQASIAETTAMHHAAFRRDFFAYDNPDLGAGPWNMNTSCASILNNVTEPIATFFAGIDSDTATVYEVDQQLLAGYQFLDLNLELMPAFDSIGMLPGTASVAYMLAAKITDNVWEQLMGERLTIVNQYARNAWQKEMHQYLTEEIFITNNWSLKELIVGILATRFFNRSAPINSDDSEPYRLQPVFDPFVVADQTCLYQNPRGDSRSNTIGTFAIEPSHNDNCAFNGQGDLIHRYAPRTLLSSIGSALSWPEPKIFPGNAYPSEIFSASIGQYTSEFDVGSTDVEFQSLLNWDDQYGTCESPGGHEIDWVYHLIKNIDNFNAINVDSPLNLGELVLTLKDWLIQEPFFDAPRLGGLQVAEPIFAVEPKQPESVEKTLSEAQFVGALFGMGLDDHVTSESVDEAALRQLCGAYLKAPQFMLAGIVRSNNFEAPRYRVCNDDNCSYRSMCNTYRPMLNKLEYPIACADNSIIDPIKKSPLKLYTSDKDDGGAYETAELCIKC